MRKLGVILGGLLLVSACHKESVPSPTEPTSTKDVDALWALTPEGAIGGIVASPRAVAMFEHTWTDIHAWMKAVPELAPIVAELDTVLTKQLGSPELDLARLGLSHDKGAAVFMVGPKQSIVIVPLGDRDKFLATVHGTKGAKDGDSDRMADGTCKLVKGVYACASDPSLFDKLGKGSLRDQLRGAEARGDIEGAAAIPLGPSPVAVAGVIQLARGAFTLRGAVTGAPSPAFAIWKTPRKPRVDLDHDAGFAVIDVPEAALANIPPAPIGPGVTAADLARSIASPITVTAPAGETASDARMPLHDTKPMKAVLDQCEALGALAHVTAKLDHGVCSVTLPNTPFVIDAWLEGQELRIGKKPTPVGHAVAVSGAGKELARGSWNLAMWGHGTVFVPTGLIPAGTPLPPLPPEAMAAIRALTMFNEMGLGMRIEGDTVHFLITARTAWANPDDVVAKLTAIPPEDVMSGKASAAVQAIADAAPQTPFAADLKSGYGGMLIPAAVVGILAAVAIPAFMDYMKRSKQTESTLNLRRLGKALTAYYAEHQAFPAGDVAPPATSCCDGPKGKCPAADWSGPIWKALDFEIDRPTLFRYGYHSDGAKVVAVAIGDLDCDGTAITYQLDVNAGGMQVTEPPPNSD